MRVTLIDIRAGGPGAPAWELGPVRTCRPEPAAVAVAADHPGDEADGWVLFWSARLGPPPPTAVVDELTARPVDGFSAGLALGTGGLPHLLDHVKPIGIDQLDVPVDVESTSWRVTLEALLVRRSALATVGGPDAVLATLGGAGLELGRRLATRGAALRATPALLAHLPATPAPQPPPSPADELALVRAERGRFWAGWAVSRALLVGPHRLGVLRAARGLAGPGPAPWPPLEATPPDRLSPVTAEQRERWAGTVAALVPTLDRETYLDKTLHDLAAQRVPLGQVVVIDQGDDPTLPERLAAAHPDLPLQVLSVHPPGQSTARNAGLRVVTCDWILFVDDDVECDPDLVERHLVLAEAFGADASCGITDEVGAGDPPPAFRLVRSADVFPTCNALARRDAVLAAGGFDLAYDHGPRADRDLGIRLHLAGANMVLNPLARLLHHHAPRGGLRAHGARVVTYAASRTTPGVRHLPAATELYQAATYFTPRQVREAEAIRLFATLSTHGSPLNRAKGLALGLWRLPDTVRKLREVRARAEELRRDYPQLIGGPPDRA